MIKKNNLTRSRNSTKGALKWFIEVGYQYATMTETDARNIARVNRTTFDRWLKGLSSPPAATLELLRLHAYGEPPSGFSKAWAGFRFQNDKIIDESGNEFYPNDLKAVFYWRKMAFNNMHKSGGVDYNQVRSDLQKYENHKGDLSCVI